MKKIFLILLTVCLGLGTQLQAQTNPAPDVWANSGVVPNGESLLAAFSIEGFEAPAAGTTDWTAAVDADDASILLAFNRAEPNNLGEFVSILQVNEPPSGSFHIVFYDVSAMTFHILNDENGAPLEIEWIADVNGAFIEGFGISPLGSYPGEGNPDLPGDADFETIILILPVELIAFTGEFNEKEVRLNWATATEIDNDFFAVERSADGSSFVEIGRVAGANAAASYNLIDDSPAEGVNFYRLRQQDVDGSFAYSEVIQVVAAGLDRTATVFPNPTTGSFTLSLKGEWRETITVSLLDQNGRVISTFRQRSGTQIELPLPAVPAGIYQVRAEDGAQVVTSRLVVR